MTILLCLVFMCIAYNVESYNSISEGTELVFVLMTHRHGDRTPIKIDHIHFNDDMEKLIQPWGYEQLTDAGKRTSYKTGRFIRRRYNDLISDKYNCSEIYVRSTDTTRSQMSVLTALSAIYPAAAASWSEDVNWEPVPYTTVPAKYDFNQAVASCPKFTAAFLLLLNSPNLRMNMYSDVIEKISQIINLDIRRKPAMMFVVNDLFLSLKSLGYNFGEEVKSLGPKISAAADEAIDIIWGDRRYISLQAGVLLDEFFTYANKIISGEDTQRVRIYSGHDFNVYSLEAVSRVTPRQGVPKYGSLFALELRRVIATGEYVVLPVYLSDPHVSEERYLMVQGCGHSYLCNYHKFYALTLPHIHDETTWRCRCDSREQLVMDTSVID